MKEGLTPDATGKVQYSIGSLYESNYVRQFFGIGFEKTETDNGDGTTSVSYSYAVQNENVRSVFEVANIAVNKINFEGLEDTEEITWSEVETNYLNPYLEKGYKFVYGDNAPEISFEMTYVGAEAVVVETTEKATGKENVELSIQWHYSMDKNDTVAELTENDTVKGLSRGQTTVTAQLGSLSSLTVEATVSVLKDATEYQIYQNSTDADFFAAEEVANDNAYSTVRLNGGYWNDIESTSAYQNPGYIAIKNPNSEDGTYSLSTTKLWMDFYFTGNNMPNVEFFGTQIEGLDFGA
ncbi:MAG: hypothetical protein IJ984_05750, partial [Prevotella sp.]|nr:hypothetical protein [Prevotella sp.]